MPFKKVAGSFFNNSDFQKDRALAGKSPCPVVEATNMVSVYEERNSYNSMGIRPLEGRFRCRQVHTGLH